MYRIVLVCHGLPAEKGNQAAHDITADFAEVGDCYASVRCDWNGSELILCAESPDDENGSLTADYFYKSIMANVAELPTGPGTGVFIKSVQRVASTVLWSAWHTSAEVRQNAEAWITKPENDWTEDHSRLADLIHSAPDKALATMFAIMQMTDDQKILGGLAAGPLEEFLGVHGEAYLDMFHTLALEHRRLREVLDGVWQGAMPKRVWHRIEMWKQRSFS